jgi:hypothetical protein
MNNGERCSLLAARVLHETSACNLSASRRPGHLWSLQNQMSITFSGLPPAVASDRTSIQRRAFLLLALLGGSVTVERNFSRGS